jgi:hypothetical protein
MDFFGTSFTQLEYFWLCTQQKLMGVAEAVKHLPCESSK